MGGDGGQVIDRATMVKTKGWGLTKGSGDRYANSLGEMANYVQMVSEDRGLGPLERHRMRMTTCWLSQQVLSEPVVACRLGNLYNKEAILGALLNRAIPEQVGHIRGLKDVKQCLLTWAEAEKDSGERRMVCPVSREDLDAGSSRAILIWPSGAVIALKTLKELKLKECPLTGQAFDPVLDIVPLAPEGEELDRLRERLPPPPVKKRKVAEASASASASEPGSAAPAAASASASASSAPSAEAKKGQPPAAKEAAAAADDAAKVRRREEKDKDKDNDGKSAVWKSMFHKDGSKDGLTGTRDAFGTPAYNRGTRV